MCEICGCGSTDSQVRISRPGDQQKEDHHHDHDHVHSHEKLHSHDHSHDHDHDESGRLIRIEQDILGKNRLAASRNAGYFEAKQILALNLMSSPGSGKTTLLEKTIPLLREKREVAVIEGDQQSMNDAARIESLGVQAVQINTGSGCHLDAEMVIRAARMIETGPGSILFIENVGNLVCPALFELGEAYRVVIFSVTEGEDKPQKYPHIFQQCDLCIINKTDLLPYVDFNVKKSREQAREVNPSLEFIELSARTGEGLDQWIDWVIQKHPLRQV